jgi:hypothetical protein
MLLRTVQIEIIGHIKANDFQLSCQKLIRDEHPQVYCLKDEKEWTLFINLKIKEANYFGIKEYNNMYMYVLITAKYPQYFRSELPVWATQILTKPITKEDNKIILLCKEIFKLNKTPLNS